MKPTLTPTLAQIKLHRYFGGGEIYARLLCEAVASAGGSTLLITHPEAQHWREFSLPNTQRIEAVTLTQALEKLPASVPLLTHSALPEAVAKKVASERPLIGIVHMPFGTYFAEAAAAYRHYHHVVPVSAYIAATLVEAGLIPYKEPLLGCADFDRFNATNDPSENCEIGMNNIVRRSEFEWDRRKVRDRFLGWGEPVWSKLPYLRPHCSYQPKPGLTLGIVSRIAPIKQFDRLFEIIAPIIAQRPNVNLEIFGAGGYASIRDLRHALKPIATNTRFWGYQLDVAAIYKHMDVLIAGLPEKEALGLNVIEAQACGTPVAAVNAPPFVETILNEQTGFLYVDPRQDGGKDFAALLDRLIEQKRNQQLPNPALAIEHLTHFSKPAFFARVGRLMDSVVTHTK